MTKGTAARRTTLALEAFTVFGAAEVASAVLWRRAVTAR
jgi:hypothetical protein